MKMLTRQIILNSNLIMRLIKLFLSCIIFLTMVSCNLLSPKNLSNDLRWKNKKFSQPYGIVLQYTPAVNTELPKNREPWFYTAADSSDTDKKYHIKTLLQEKFGNRNIFFSDSSTVKLRIEKLLFREYSEPVTVYDEDAEYVGESTQDFFIFEISGSLLMKDSVAQQVIIEHHYNNEPRESYVLDGVIVMGGGNASASKMIENSISEFSYRVYEAINEKIETAGK